MKTAETEFPVENWSSFEAPEGEAPEVFKKAFCKLVGVGYTPLLVTSQLVNGKRNFIFLTSANLMHPDALPYSAFVRVYGDTEEAKIVTIVPHGSPSKSFLGGYSPFTAVSGEDLELFNKVIKGFDGSGFDAKYVSKQLVAESFNYKFAGTQTMMVENLVKYPALMTVYAPRSGDPVITGIEKVFNLV
jgi:hypothetical protein